MNSRRDEKIDRNLRRHFHQALHRREEIDHIELPLLICKEASRFIGAKQLREVEVMGAKILWEPRWRNTAHAIAAASHDNVIVSPLSTKENPIVSIRIN